MTTQDKWRSMKVKEIAGNLRARLLPLDGPIDHKAFIELRELQLELDKMVTRCRRHLRIEKHEQTGA